MFTVCEITLISVTTMLEAKCTGFIILTLSSKRRTKENFLLKMSGFKDFHKLHVLTMAVKACETNCLSKTAS